MPFTFSHPAIVLPLNYLPKRWLSLTALVIGSITPDFEYFIRMKVQSVYSHTWLGLFWFDLPLAYVLMIIYNSIVKNKLIDNLPLYLNKRLSVFRNNTDPADNYYFPVVILSIIIGTASHLLWDGFTHPTGYFVTQIPELTHAIPLMQHKFPLYNIIQHFSSFAGAYIIITTLIRLQEGKETKNFQITNYWIILLIVMLLVLGLRFATGLDLHQVGNIIVTMITGILFGLIITSLLTRTNRERLA
jgi:hypothetical protein